VERFRCRVGFHRGLHDCGQIQETRGIKRWKFFSSRDILGNFLSIFFNTASSAASDSTVSVDVGMESKTVETLALAVSRTDHTARSHPPAFSMLVQKRFCYKWHLCFFYKLRTFVKIYLNIELQKHEPP
jgi:hypothetical protein